jgi:hypothetical protein
VLSSLVALRLPHIASRQGLVSSSMGRLALDRSIARWRTMDSWPTILLMLAIFTLASYGTIMIMKRRR